MDGWKGWMGWDGIGLDEMDGCMDARMPVCQSVSQSVCLSVFLLWVAIIFAAKTQPGALGAFLRPVTAKDWIQQR